MDENEEAELQISEDLVQSPQHKQAAVASIDFDGLLALPLRLHEDLKQGCGGQLWPAGMVLAKYILGQLSFQNQNILELGAGGGLVGLAIASALKPGSTSHVTITDQLPMLSLMERNIQLNALGHLVTAKVLDWGSSITISEQPTVILGADLVYYEPAFPLLLQTLEHLIGPDTICYFCFKKRRRADLNFMKSARRVFKVKPVVDDPEQSSWCRQGIFMYTFQSKLSNNR